MTRRARGKHAARSRIYALVHILFGTPPIGGGDGNGGESGGDLVIGGWCSKVGKRAHRGVGF